jgi:CubicO group peptidase (beta-lactamase class C family)
VERLKPDERPPTARELGLGRGSLVGEDRRVTLKDWQRPPWNRWSFQHVSELVPTARVGRGEVETWELPPDPLNLDGVRVETVDGATTLTDFLARSCTDGFLVLRDGRVAAEAYFNGMTAHTPHLLQSVSKSVVGTLAGCLVEEGSLQPERPVTEYLPEMRGSSFDGATVRQLLDMSTGTRFTEDYDDPSSDVNLYEAAAGWRTAGAGEEPGDLLAYSLALPNEREHGELFEYRSILTDILASVMERAAGLPLAELLSSRIWSRLGASSDASLAVDPRGHPMADAGLSVTLRDLGRFGQLMLQNGCVAGRQVVPSAWIDDTRYADDDWRYTFLSSQQAWRLAICDSLAQDCTPHGHYRNQWWVPDPERGILLGSGIYGQTLYVHMAAGAVVVKLSSQPQPFGHEAATDVLNACAAIVGALRRD